MNEINERILWARKRIGLSQEAVGKAYGVSRQAVQKWELGTSRPKDFAKLGKILDVSKIWLQYGPTNENSQPPNLPPDEQALLANYRAADTDGKKAIQTVGIAVKKPVKKQKVNRKAD